MKLFGGLLTLCVALVISGVAAYFSVVGLAAIFAATFWAVIVMGVSLEVGKLVAAGWLHANWRNTKVGRLHKAYMTAAVVVLMIITALGIYGFLSKGHLEQEASNAPNAIIISQKETRIEQLNGEVARLTARQDQLDTMVNSVMEKNPQNATRVRRQQATERSDITGDMKAAQGEIAALQTELVPLKTQTAAVEAKLGPIKYLAELFGWENPEAAVRLVILLLMFAFDPLAVVLVISAIITIEAALVDRRTKTNSVQPTDVIDEAPAQETEVEVVVDHLSEPETVPEPVVEDAPEIDAEPEPESNLLAELDSELHERDEPKSEPSADTDLKQLVEIMERNPELAQNLVQAVIDTANATSYSGIVNEDATPPTKPQVGDWRLDGLDIPQR